jgi:hypothetical protein
MTLYQFNQLDEMEQAEVLWDKAVKLAASKEEVFLYTLYQVDGFYIETKRHIEHDVLQGLRSFLSTGEPLKPYLDQIRIKGINS